MAVSMAILLGGVALTNTVAALKNSTKQDRIKRAQQAADAGMDAAVFRLNRLDLLGKINVDPLDPETITSQNCIANTSGNALGVVPLPTTSTWCGEVGETLDNGASWKFRVSEL